MHVVHKQKYIVISCIYTNHGLNVINNNVNWKINTKQRNTIKKYESWVIVLDMWVSVGTFINK